MGSAKSHQAQAGAIAITRIGQLRRAKRHDGAIAVAKLFADFPKREPCRRKAGREVRRLDEQIFGGDQMSDWTVMGRGRRYTFDNPQPALYDRIAAVKALVGEVPVEGRLLFSNVGKFTKGIPKWVMMLDGIEVEFPQLNDRSAPNMATLEESWGMLTAQLKPSPHLLTNL